MESLDVSTLESEADLSAEELDSTPDNGDEGELGGILARARARGASEGLKYAGSVLPGEAWRLFRAGAAALVDVRTLEERKFVGHIPESQHVAWATGTALTRNPRFVRELEARVKKDQTILLLCRSGKRSAAAAEAATAAGFTQVFNVLQGFEGDLTENGHRGELGGWRYWNLPWVQD